MNKIIAFLAKPNFNEVEIIGLTVVAFSLGREAYTAAGIGALVMVVVHTIVKGMAQKQRDTKGE